MVSDGNVSYYVQRSVLIASDQHTISCGFDSHPRYTFNSIFDNISMLRLVILPKQNQSYFVGVVVFLKFCELFDNNIDTLMAR